MRKTEKRKRSSFIENIYKLLYKRFGPRHWWPGETQLEIIIGAILTQNTAWGNVEKAIANLKKYGLLKNNSVKRLSEIDEKKLSGLIRPTGYYNIKAKRIKNFLSFLNSVYNGSIKRMFKTETPILREELLKIKGIGYETADSILLYAGKKPVFVIDSYTKRIFSRHGFIGDRMDYIDIQNFLSENLPLDVKLFNEFHALIVELGKSLCKSKRPLCDNCPIRRIKNA